MVPIEFAHKTLRKASQLNLDIIEAKKERFQKVNQLDELGKEELFHTKVIQKQRNGWHDRFIKSIFFRKETRLYSMIQDTNI